MGEGRESSGAPPLPGIPVTAGQGGAPGWQKLVTPARDGCYGPRGMAKRVYGLIGLALLCGVLGGCKSVKKSYEDHFKATYTLQFNSACVKRAMQDRISEARAKSYCACTARYLVDHHGMAELVLVGMSSSPSSQKAIEAASRACGVID
jgi:hypothetical protein